MSDVDKPFAGGRWTEAKYRGFITNTLRRASMRWPVKADVKNAARRNYDGPERNRFEYQCASCLQWHFGKEVQVDHIEPIGSCDNFDTYIGRLFCEADNLQVLCKGCHRAKKVTR